MRREGARFTMIAQSARHAAALCLLLAVAAIPAVALAQEVTPQPAAAPQAAVVSDDEQTRVQLTPRQQARLLSRMSGTVSEVAVRDGATVKAGDVIVRFDCTEREQMAAQARARKTKQDSLVASSQKLVQLGSGSKVDLRVREAEAQEAAANYAQMQAEADYCMIAAPFDGRVAAIEVKAFQNIREGDFVAEMIDDTALEAEMIVPSRWMAWLKPGHQFDISVDETGKSYRAEITHLGGRVDAVSQSVRAYATVAGRPQELLSGMSGTAALSPPAQGETP